MVDICASDLFSNQTICEVMSKLDDLGEQSIEMRDLATAAIDALNSATTSGINTLQNINYNANTTGVDKAFAAPDAIGAVPDFAALGPTSPIFPDAPIIDGTHDVDAAPSVPEAYTVPSATTQLITNEVFDAIYNREADRVAEVGVKAERDAFYLQSSMGIGLPSSAKTIALAAAEEETGLKISDTARDKAVQEGVNLREDVKTLHGLHVENWPLRPRIVLDSYKAEEGLEVDAYKATELAKTQGYETVVRGLAAAYDSQIKWVLGYLNAETQRHQALLAEFQAELAREAERRGWSQMEINQILTEADKQTGYAISKAQFLLDTARETAQATAQLLAGITQALYSAASYHLGGSAAQNVTE